MQDIVQTRSEFKLVDTSDLNVVAASIRNHHQKVVGAIRDALTHAMAAGDELVAIEQTGQVRHGEWTDWVESHCDLNARTARRYMQLARNRGVIDAERSRATDLSIAGALKLIAKTPDSPPCESGTPAEAGAGDPPPEPEHDPARGQQCGNDAEHDPAASTASNDFTHQVIAAISGQRKAPNGNGVDPQESANERTAPYTADEPTEPVDQQGDDSIPVFLDRRHELRADETLLQHWHRAPKEEQDALRRLAFPEKPEDTLQARAAHLDALGAKKIHEALSPELKAALHSLLNVDPYQRKLGNSRH